MNSAVFPSMAPAMPLPSPRNHWGHNKNKPELDLFVKGRKRPQQIQSLINAMKDYFHNPFKLPTLANLNGHKNSDGYPRRNRSDGREAEIKVAQAILASTDFASLRVGTPQNNGEFIPRTCVELAEMCDMLSDPSPAEIEKGIPLKPSKRFWRAFSRLNAGGMFTVTRQFKKELVIRNGEKVAEYRARPAIKVLNPHFLVCLGTMDYDRLKAFRDHCSQQLTSRRQLHAKKFGDAQDKKAAEAALRRIQELKGVKTNNPRKPVSQADIVEKLKRRYHAEKIRLQANLIKKGITSPKAIISKINAKLGTESEYISLRT